MYHFMYSYTQQCDWGWFSSLSRPGNHDLLGGVGHRPWSGGGGGEVGHAVCATVVPIPKEQPPRIDRLRPISLTSAFAKIAEEFVCDWILADIQPRIDTRQYGNVKGASTCHYLVRLIHDLCSAADKSRNIGTIVLTDFTKAFDLIDHNILINKIINIGVRGSIVPWICDFLSCREQCVKYNSTLSNYISLKGGIPQGTKLGPIGFQILVNDAGQSTTTKYLKYVDDLSFYENRSISQQGILQHDLNVFYDWCAENSLQLNAKKCKALQVCFAKNPPLIQPCFDDKPITVVDKTVILGVTLQNNLKWNTQVNNIVTKANRKLFMLRNLKKFGLDKQELCAVYEGYIRPLL